MGTVCFSSNDTAANARMASGGTEDTRCRARAGGASFIEGGSSPTLHDKNDAGK